VATACEVVESGAPAPLPTAHHRLDDDEHLITLLHHIRGLYSGDFDIWIRPSRENSERIFRALYEFGAPVAEHGISIQDLQEPDTVYQIGLPPRRIDLMTGISGVEFEDASKSKVVVNLEGLAIPVIGRSELIRNKRASGRAKDLIDLEILESPRGSQQEA